MKKLFVAALLVCVPLLAERNSRSFLYVRPIFNNLAAHHAGWHDSWFDIEKDTAFQFSMNYQKSFDSEKLKRYFLPSNRDQVVFRQNAAIVAGDNTDVRSDWLGITNANFTGTFTIKPEQWQACWNISVRKSFPQLLDNGFFDRMWGFIDIPVVATKSSLNFAQVNVSNAGGTIPDIVSAFSNTAWNYQKIKTDRTTKIQAGQVRVGFGTTFLSNHRATAATYSALSIPTAKKQSNEYMFQPQVGFNGHFGMIWGAQLQLPLAREGEPNFGALFLEFENTYLIRNYQNRTFDLKNKQWSRFMQYRITGVATTVPGVNVLTKRVRVSGYSTIDVSGGLRFYVGKLAGELGFGVWGKTNEGLKLDRPWENTYGIAGTGTNSASASTISTLAADDAAFTPVRESDLDFDSASATPTVLFRIHGALGANGRGEQANGLFSCGFFVEIPKNETTAFSQWGIWAKFGGGF